MSRQTEQKRQASNAARLMPPLCVLFPAVGAPSPGASISEAICGRIMKRSRSFVDGPGVPKRLRDSMTVNGMKRFTRIIVRLRVMGVRNNLRGWMRSIGIVSSLFLPSWGCLGLILGTFHVVRSDGGADCAKVQKPSSLSGSPIMGGGAQLSLNGSHVHHMRDLSDSSAGGLDEHMEVDLGDMMLSSDSMLGDNGGESSAGESSGGEDGGPSGGGGGGRLAVPTKLEDDWGGMIAL